MPELFGTGYPRAGLLRLVGRLEQIAGVRPVTLGDGQGRGVRVLEFRTGTGFAFEVLIDRCFGALQGTAALDEFGNRVSRLLPVDDTADRR